MRSNIRKRLNDIETTTTDWAADLDVIDYGVLDDYTGNEWTELHHDTYITVVRHSETGEVRGYYRDRRSHEQIQSEGGNLEYL